MNHQLLLQFHMLLAGLSLTGFVLRWVWRMCGSDGSGTLLTNVVPHVLDTIFLGSGIVLAIGLGQYPVTHGWLTAKVSGLVLYILLGMGAMRTTPSWSKSLPFFVTALAAFSWVVSVAFLRQPAGYFSSF